MASRFADDGGPVDGDGEPLHDEFVKQQSANSSNIFELITRTQEEAKRPEEVEWARRRRKHARSMPRAC